MFGNVYWLLMPRIDLSVSENYKIKSWKQMYFVNYTSSFVLGFSNFLRAAIFRIYLDHYREKEGDDNLKFRFETVGSTDGV